MQGDVAVMTVLLGVLLWVVARSSRPPRYSDEQFIQRLEELVSVGEFALAFRHIENEIPGIHPYITCTWIVDTWVNQNPDFTIGAEGLVQLLAREGLLVDGMAVFETPEAVYVITY